MLNRRLTRGSRCDCYDGIAMVGCNRKPSQANLNEGETMLAYRMLVPALVLAISAPAAAAQDKVPAVLQDLKPHQIVEAVLAAALAASLVAIGLPATRTWGEAQRARQAAADLASRFRLARQQAAGSMIVDQLRDRIVSGLYLGRWAPGERLPSIRDVADAENVDRKTAAAGRRCEVASCARGYRLRRARRQGAGRRADTGADRGHGCPLAQIHDRFR